MLNVKSFLAVDFGAGSLKLAEFEVNETGGLRLKQFVLKPIGLEGSQETKREGVILKALQGIIAERGIKAKEVNVCAPGFHVFSKFVKLPPVESGKVTQIIQYEAQQNVPFPLAEVVWDYQILGTAASGELEVLLVAIKADIVEGLFRVAESAGLRLQLCDVSPAALCNAFRYNYGDLEGCTMLLDIGAKTSNLLFFEGGKVFSRSINLGANSITQDFANESKHKFDVAEKIKIDEGFVSLGGAYEEPESPNQAAISKIARQFMTRLHIQVNQTLQFYRGQQGGSAPQRLFLSGGASLMPYTAQFFAEKLSVPVEYFNPFRSVQIDPTVNLEELARVAHSLGEVVGLGLRNLAHCPVELNLMPESTLRWQSFNQKKPYFIATLASLVLMAFAVGYLFEKQAANKKEQAEKLAEDIGPADRKSRQFDRAYHVDWQRATNDLAQVAAWLEARYYWADVLSEVRQVLVRVEEEAKRKLYGNEAGIWLETLHSTAPPAISDPSLTPPGGALMGGGEQLTPEQFEQQYYRYRTTPPQDLAAPTAEPAPGADPYAAGVDPYTGQPLTGATQPGWGAAPAADQRSTISLLFRAVSVNQFPAANPEMAYAVLDELKKSPLFDPATTQFIRPAGATEITEDSASGTFTFGVALTLKQPLKLL